MITGADICPIPFIAKAKPDIVEACLQRKKISLHVIAL
jgi:hypothetical protein